MVPGFKPFTSFKYSNKELLRCHYGDSNGIEKAKKAMGQDWKATACTNSTFFCTFLCSYCTTTTSIKQIDDNYPWSVLLSTTELTSKVQNSSVTTSSGERFHCGFTAKFWTFDSISTTTSTVLTAISVEVSPTIAHARKRKTNCVTIQLFLWSVWSGT